MVGTRLPHSTCSLSDSLQNPFLIRQRAVLLLQQKASAKLASIQFRGTPPMPPQTTAQGCVILPCLSPLRGLQNFNCYTAPFKCSVIRLKESIPYMFYYSEPRLNSVETFCDHNIEFSCPAASDARKFELPSRIHGSIRPLRGQLQRFVIHPH